METDTQDKVIDLQEAADIEQLLAEREGSDYVDKVVQLYEESERNYRAAIMAGHVVNGFTDSTNY